MFHIERAHLKDLEPIYRASTVGGSYRNFCLSVDGCAVEDVYALERVKIVSELVVSGPDYDAERAKWSSIPALTYRYFSAEK